MMQVSIHIAHRRMVLIIRSSSRVRRVRMRNSSSSSGSCCNGGWCRIRSSSCSRSSSSSCCLGIIANFLFWLVGVIEDSAAKLGENGQLGTFFVGVRRWFGAHWFWSFRLGLSGCRIRSWVHLLHNTRNSVRRDNGTVRVSFPVAEIRVAMTQQCITTVAIVGHRRCRTVVR